MTNSIGNILRSLNESIDTNTGVGLTIKPNEETPDGGKVKVPENDETATKFHCDACDKDFDVNEGEDPVCPDCGGEGVPAGKLVEYDEVEEEPTVEEECEDMLDEALTLLAINDYKKFNEKYSSVTRLTSSGKLQVMVESAVTGKTYLSAPRKMTSRQKAAYHLAENYVSSVKTTSNKSSKFEAIQIKRLALVARNESRMTKIACRKVLERMGIRFDVKKFNEAIDAEIESRDDDLTKKIEDIVEDEPTVITTIEEIDPEELQESVKSVFESVGLDVLSSEHHKDGNSDVVDLRVEDSPNLEVYADEIKEVLEDALSSEVDIVGPVPATEGSDVKDLSVIVNPEDETNECDDLDNEDQMNEEDDPELSSENDIVDECDDLDSMEKKIKESIRNRRMRGRKSVREADEVDTTVIGDLTDDRVKVTDEAEDYDQGLFALKTTESTNDDPEFLTNDDSVVKGNDKLSESYARFFVNKKAAQRFVDVRGMNDRFVPVSVSVRRK